MSQTLNTDTIDSPPRDAATVVLLREAGPDSEEKSEFEVLLLCRGNSRTVMNNAWVFPGGKVDNNDYSTSQLNKHSNAQLPQQLLAEPDLATSDATALFNAACRETQEETGVILSPEQLYPWSRWITPKDPALMKKRFDARFFLAEMPAEQSATHDGVEATDSVWLRPRSALRAYYENQITLAPPQIMTLAALSRHLTIQSCLDYAAANEPHHVEPFVVKGENQTRTLTYPGDTAHPSNHQSMPGPTRLLWQNGRFEPPEGFESFFQTAISAQNR
ncbi:hypothetical protein AB833_27315 [Chromatiales bacterium (ex Bugula neritina AB1)]|nr:hypothetical protein AB833_27315 [Chromatiales bacterium (ex Bugula neritina AB1)]